MGEYENVTINMVYDELLKLKQEVARIEYAVISVEQLSQKELEEHRKDLEEALKGERINFRNLKR